MNWKQILIKGVPVFVIAAIIVIIAVIAGRPKPQPKLTGDYADDLVVDYKGLKVTNAELYDMMKYNAGLNSLLEKIDRTLLEDYDIDETALKDKIAAEKEEDEEAFYNEMITLGVITSKDQADAEAKIENYYKVEFLQKAYTKEQAVLDLAAEGETDVEDAIADLKINRDLCVIPLKYDTRQEANDALATLDGLSGVALREEFARIWEIQNPTDETEEVEEETLDTFYSDFTCNYERVIYKTATTSYRDLLFGEEQIAVGEYNDPAILTSQQYHIVYKVSQAPAIDENDADKLAELETYVTDQLISDRLDTSYIKAKMNDLREDHDLKIYDSRLVKQYKEIDPTFKGSEYKNKSTLATYTIVENGETVKKTITTDMLYEDLKAEYAVENLMDLVNYEALSSIEGIKLSKKEINAFKEDIDYQKTKFLAQGQAQTMTWSEFLASMGIFSENQLMQQYSLRDLVTRYILGYEDEYAGVAPVTDEEINEAADEWFNYKASHIFITYGENSVNPDGRTKEVAEAMATQIIEGCTQTEIDADTCYIETTDDEGDLQSFTSGLDGTSVAEFNAVFTELAKNYSDDTGSKNSGGDLGYFGHGAMVPEFEAAAKEIVANNSIFSEVPVESTVPAQTETLHGFHIIYITDTIEPDPKPENYDEIEDPADSEDTLVTNYYNHLQTIKVTIEGERKKSEFINKKLAELRDTSEFVFLDETIQAHYEAINTLHKAYEEE